MAEESPRDHATNDDEPMPNRHHKITRGRHRLPEPPSTGFHLRVDGSGAHLNGVFGRYTPPAMRTRRILASSDSVDFPSVRLVRAAQHSGDDVVFRHESFACVRLAGCGFAPNPRPSAPFSWESHQYRHKLWHPLSPA